MPLVRSLLSVVVAGVAGASCWVLAAPHARAEPAPSAELTAARADALLDDVLPPQLEKFAIPGAAVVIVADGDILTTRGFGLADVEADVPVDPEETGMFTGSVAKTFTAVAVQQLVEQGKVDLDRDVNDYLDGWEIADTYPGRPVTLRHLLTHTAGFDYRVPLGAGERDDDHGRSLRQQVEHQQPKRVRPPGAGKVSYDNYGPSLAGLVVEEVSGQPFEEYVQKHIFDPLAMTGSTMVQPQPAEVRDHAATAYRVSASGVVTATYGQFGPLVPTGSATLTTAEDMGRFMLAQLPEPQRSILSPASVRDMQSTQASPDPRLPGMGLIWELYEHDGSPMVAKDGDIPGAHTNMVLLPEQKVGIYVAYNGDGADNSAWFAGKELQRQFLERFYPNDPATAGSATAGGEVAADAYSGTYLARNTSRTELIGASGLVGGVTVTSDEDGSLQTVDPMAENPEHVERDWVRVGDRAFQEAGGVDRLVFTADGNSLAISSRPMYTYERLPGYLSPVLHQIILYGGMAPVLVAMIGWPIAAAVRRRQGSRPAQATRGAQAARVIAWATGAAMIAYVISFLQLMGDGAALNETLFLGDSPLLIIVRITSSLALVGAGAMIIFAALSWLRGWWGVLGRLVFTVSAVGLVASLAVCIAHSMVGPGLW